MIINCVNTSNIGVNRKMNRIRAVELSLIAQRAYDPGDYIAEIKEIFKCITENKEYDDAPDLSKAELVAILENLTSESDHPNKYSLRKILKSSETANIKEKKQILRTVQDILFA